MKKYLVFITLILFSISMLGCGKKQQAAEEMSESISMETLSTITTTASEPSTPGPAVTPAPAVLQPLPPTGPYKPAAVEIQTALKNTGYYTAEIDGKIGPKTKKAIEEFQRANALEVDGKVGPKTWSVLSKYLNPQPQSVAPGERR